ncbi:MAG TPA: hypothetical protein VNL17_08695 [Verrucomicrobiae bacterium]|nr:hypothetical protein [Verrucomicrobiae bacterium]
MQNKYPQEVLPPFTIERVRGIRIRFSVGAQILLPKLATRYFSKGRSVIAR